MFNKILKLAALICIVNYMGNSMAEKQKQTMPSSSLWQTLAQNNMRSVKEVQSQFLDNVRAFSYENKHIPKIINYYESERREGFEYFRLRLVCFNVRMWTNIHEESNFEAVSKLVQELNPDILLLQEVVDWDKTREHYVSLGYCPIAAHCATQNPPFGPIIFVKGWETVSIESKVFKHQMNPNRQLCYVRMDLEYGPSEMPITIYNTHLEVDQKQLSRSTEDVRELQLQEILADARTIYHQNIIIAGDFNSVQEKDYTYLVDGQSVWELLKQAYAHNNIPLMPQVLERLAKDGYKDCFEYIGWEGPKFTNWASRVLDFVYLSSGWNQRKTPHYWGLLPAASYIYYTDVSDHLPIIVDFDICDCTCSQCMEHLI